MVPDTISGLGSFSGLGNFRLVPPPVIGAGYFAGGDSSVGRVATVNKFAFSDDSRTTLATGLSVASHSLAGMANSGTAGYFGGGDSSGGNIATINKFLFLDDSRTTLVTGLSSSCFRLAAMANSGTAGYFGGGKTNSVVDTVDKFTFSNDSRSTLASPLSTQLENLAAYANSGTAGYFVGGNTNTNFGATGRVRTVHKYAFSGDTLSTLENKLAVARENLAAMANSGTAGYAAGGYSATSGFTKSSSIEKLLFSNDTNSTIGATLNQGRYLFSAMANSGTAGYFGGGGDSYSATVDKIAFSNDTTSTLGTGLSTARNKLGAMANSGTL
jgi:hypothetical protein